MEGEEWGRTERVEEGKGGEEKGTEGWGRKLGRDWGLCSSKNSFKSRGPRPTFTLRQIVAPVQDLVYAIYMQSGPYSVRTFSAFA